MTYIVDNDIVTAAKILLSDGGLSLLGGEEALFLYGEDYIRFVKDCQQLVILDKKCLIIAVYIYFLHKTAAEPFRRRLNIAFVFTLCMRCTPKGTR